MKPTIPWRHATLAALLACAASCSGTVAPPTGRTGSPTPSPARAGLACVLTAPGSVPLTESVVPVGFTLRNDGEAALTVLGRQTPLEGMLGNLFAVMLESRRLDYRGPMVKRGPPGADEFVTIAPGLHAHATVDLAAAYDLSSPGTYRVRFDRHDEFTCNELTIERH